MKRVSGTMCLNRLNITTLLCDRVDENNLIAVFDTVRPKYNNGKPELSMTMLINVVANFKKNNLAESNSVEKDTTYEVLVRLNYVKTGSGVNIYAFEFSTYTRNKMCREICEMRKLIDIQNLELPNGTGDYGIKIFVRKKGKESWSLQTVQGFKVGL